MVNTMSDEQERLVIKDNFQTIIKPLLDQKNSFNDSVGLWGIFRWQ